MLSTGKTLTETRIAIYNYLVENPLTWKEMLFLNWIDMFVVAGDLDEPVNPNIFFESDGENYAELTLPIAKSPAAMIAGINYLEELKKQKGGLFPAGFEEQAKEKKLVILPSVDRLLLGILSWYGYEEGDIEQDIDSLGEEFDGPIVSEIQPDNCYGAFWNSAKFINHFMLESETPFYEMLIACSTKIDKEKGLFQLNYTSWFGWDSDNKLITYATSKTRQSRNYYTISSPDGDFALLECPLDLWGNLLVQWSISGASEDYIGALVNRDATDLLTPSRVYGDPSPLNNAVDANTVGHLKVRLNSVYNGMPTVGFMFLNDKDAFSPAKAAELCLERDMPILFQHQLEKIRVGEGAQALGKSTLRIQTVLQEDTIINGVQVPKGTVYEIHCIVGQDGVDKKAKLFNRDALCVRVTPGVTIIFPSQWEEEINYHGANQMADLAKSLIED